jgi:hypothetical protein
MSKNVLSKLAVATAGAALSLAFVQANPAQAAIFGMNLIQNGDAEVGSGSNNGSTVSSIPGWTKTGNFTVVRYNAVDSLGIAYPRATDPGPSNRGRNFFAGGRSNIRSSASQLIDISAGSAVIDGVGAMFDLSGFFGGWLFQNDNAVLNASFLSASNSVLNMASIGGVTSGDRGSQTGLLERSTSGIVPTGTRKIKVDLQMNRVGSLFNSYNDGYADNLSLKLTANPTPTPVPEPASVLGLLAVGTLGAGSTALKRKQQQKATVKVDVNNLN